MASPSSPPKPLKSGSPSPSPSVRISSPLNPNPNPNPNWSPHPTPPTLARQRRASFTLAHRDESMSYSAFASVAASSQLNPQSHSANTSPGQSSADLPQMDLLSNVRRGHSRSPHLRSSLDLTRPRALSSASSHGGNGSAHGHSPRVSSVDLTHSRTHSPSPGLPPLLQGLPLEQGSLDFSYTYTQSQTQPIDIPNHGSVVTRHHVPGDVTPPNEPPRTWWSKKMPYDPVEPAWGANADPYKAIGAHGDDNESDDDVGIEWEKGWAEGGGFETNVVPAGVGDDAGNGNAAAGFVTANEGTGRGRIERKGSSFGIGLGRVLKGRSASREKSRSVSHSQTHSRNPSIESSSQCASQFASESYQNSSPQSNYGAPHSGAQAINIPVSSTKARRPSHSHSNSLGNSYPTQFQLRNLSSNSSPSSSAHDGLSALALGMEERERAERKSRGLFSRKGHAKDSDGDISGEIAIDSAKSTPKEHTQSWIKRASWAGLYGKEASPSSGGKDIPTKEDSGHGKDKQDGKQCKDKEGHKWKTEDAQEEEYEHARGVSFFIIIMVWLVVSASLGMWRWMCMPFVEGGIYPNLGEDMHFSFRRCMRVVCLW
ncbi:hypothetical protein BJ138DRAFT_913866 [Hygrophoropsis aurantiaca]|uniref:Uncharacterized protein n=1 Tax=Hygrophoropsis aurantiaca TaxID=72124 RepID=A0ACB8AFZ2_9AGAM|nr:hypothetical protein BJ138DRAFT_913866 [Hygrophoropsis aurantiaca]